MEDLPIKSMYLLLLSSSLLSVLVSSSCSVSSATLMAFSFFSSFFLKGFSECKEIYIKKLNRLQTPESGMAPRLLLMLSYTEHILINKHFLSKSNHGQIKIINTKMYRKTIIQ